MRLNEDQLRMVLCGLGLLKIEVQEGFAKNHDPPNPEDIDGLADEIKRSNEETPPHDIIVDRTFWPSDSSFHSAGEIVRWVQRQLELSEAGHHILGSTFRTKDGRWWHTRAEVVTSLLSPEDVRRSIQDELNELESDDEDAREIRRLKRLLEEVTRA